MLSLIHIYKDHTDDLRVCVRSLFEKASYKNMEVLVVENNSTEPETFECYKELEQQYEALHVLYWKGRGFNFSAVNNFAVPSARGEYLLFLNNETELINEDCIEEPVSYTHLVRFLFRFLQIRITTRQTLLYKNHDLTGTPDRSL